MEERQVEGLHCQECGASRIYYPEVHRLDGDHRNNSPSNTVLVCPFCHTHLTFRLDHRDILILKMRGLSNAVIGRLLGISRERVRQICDRYKMELRELSNDKTVDDWVKLALERQEMLMRRQKAMEEQLRCEEAELKASKGELDETELKDWEEELAGMRRDNAMLKRRRISKRGLRKRIAAYIEGNEPEKGGKRR